jgi:hypothetical protein
VTAVDDGGAREGEAQTPFTAILGDLVGSVPGALGALFTDGEGECVDYYSVIDPWDLKVLGAHGSLLLQLVSGSGLQPITMIGISGRRLTLFVRPLGECYALTLVLSKRTWSAGMHGAIEEAVERIRAEAHLS